MCWVPIWPGDYFLVRVKPLHHSLQLGSVVTVGWFIVARLRQLLGFVASSVSAFAAEKDASE